MYDIDELDRVIELADIPWPDVGAPLPVLLSNEHRILLAYIVSDTHPIEGSYPKLVSETSGGMRIALVDVEFPMAHMFGPPNDEAFHGHPLAERGLQMYAVQEVKDSSWIRRLERMNSVHPSHDPNWFLKDLRHFVFAFHDSTFECIGRGLDVEVVIGSIEEAVAELVRAIAKTSS